MMRAGDVGYYDAPHGSHAGVQSCPLSGKIRFLPHLSRMSLKVFNNSITRRTCPHGHCSNDETLECGTLMETTNSVLSNLYTGQYKLEARAHLALLGTEKLSRVLWRQDGFVQSKTQCGTARHGHKSRTRTSTLRMLFDTNGDTSIVHYQSCLSMTLRQSC
jgi:hypothetical protein